MRRTTAAELLDEDRGTPEEIEASLDDLWRINRWLGGVRSNLCLLERALARSGRDSVRVLDVGAGDSRLAGWLRDALARRHRGAEFVVLDRRLTHLTNGTPRSRGLSAIVADVLHLPFPEASFDVVMCNLFFHHFSDEAAVDLLRCLSGIARVAVIINDLERHVLPYWFIRIAFPFARSRITRHDGPASVRQAYKRAELRELAVRAGFRDFDIERFAPFRLGLTLWKEAWSPAT